MWWDPATAKAATMPKKSPGTDCLTMSGRGGWQSLDISDWMREWVDTHSNDPFDAEKDELKDGQKNFGFVMSGTGDNDVQFGCEHFAFRRRASSC